MAQILGAGDKEFAVVNGTYVETAGNAPKQASVIVPVDARGVTDPTTFSVTDTPPAVIANGNLAALSEASFATGGIGAACSHYKVSEVLKLARSAASPFKTDLALAPYTASVSLRSDVSVKDDALTLADLPAFSAIPQARCN
jgi:hypothetical protein